MDLGLAGKTAIITGGSGGIGRGLVLEFAREGCNVISASRDGEYIARTMRCFGVGSVRGSCVMPLPRSPALLRPALDLPVLSS